MRVVYDTSVLVTSLWRRDRLIRLRKEVAAGLFVLITSPTILKEVEDVLCTKFGLTRQQARTRTGYLRKMSKVIQLTTVEPITRDPDDDMVVATAVVGKANAIVTLDNDLLIINKYNEIHIFTPSEFERILNK